MAKKKIAVLGGGIGALATICELTNPKYNPNWQDQFDITVYQLGWRLGGKGASARNMDPDCHLRIEEHGYHVWSGIYENSFRILREVYEEIGRPKDAPLATIWDAFKPLEVLYMQENWKGKVLSWEVPLQHNDLRPGEADGHLILPTDVLLTGLMSMIRQSHKKDAGKKVGPIHHGYSTSGRLGTMVHVVKTVFSGLFLDLVAILLFIAHILWLLMVGLNRLLGNTISKMLKPIILGIIGFALRHKWKKARLNLDDDFTRRSWMGTNYFLGTIRGLIADDVAQNGVWSLDKYNYTDWISRHILDDTVDGVAITMNCPLVWNSSVINFAYDQGNPKKPEFSAGSVLYYLCRWAVTTRGAFLWPMQASMGEAVFTPIYQVLAKRGVKFEFFHKVKNLGLSSDNKRIQEIQIERQVTLKAKNHWYEPIFAIKGLLCWPNRPLWEQIEGGKEMAEKGVNFEDWTTPSHAAKGHQDLTLSLGKDFDEVVLGISLGAHPYICGELIKSNPAWMDMVCNLTTVLTQSSQLWMKSALCEPDGDAFSTLGWPHQPAPVVTNLVGTQLGTWSDMSFLINREGWDPFEGNYPLNIAYFCGVMPEITPLKMTPTGPMPDISGLNQDAANEIVKQNMAHLLSECAPNMWPNTKLKDGSFDWSVLIDERSTQHSGPARLSSQYFRANIQPSERYVSADPGTLKYRLFPGKSGFENLYLAGDWTVSAFNVASIEGCVTSAMLACHALAGYPHIEDIAGLEFGYSRSTNPFSSHG